MESKKSKFKSYLNSFLKIKSPIDIDIKVVSEKSISFNLLTGKFDLYKYFLTISLLNYEKVPIGLHNKVEELCDLINENTVQENSEVFVDFTIPESRDFYISGEKVFNIEKNLVDLNDGKAAKINFEGNNTILCFSDLRNLQKDTEIIQNLSKYKSGFKNLEIYFVVINSDEDMSSSEALSITRKKIKENFKGTNIKLYFWGFNYEERKFFVYFNGSQLNAETSHVFNFINKEGRFYKSTTNLNEVLKTTESLIANKEIQRESKEKTSINNGNNISKEELGIFKKCIKNFQPKSMKSISFEWTSIDTSLKKIYVISNNKIKNLLYEKPQIQVTIPKKMKPLLEELKSSLEKGGSQGKFEIKEDILSHKKVAKNLIDEVTKNKSLNLKPIDLEIVQHFSVNSKYETKVYEVVNREKIDTLNLEKCYQHQTTEEKLQQINNYNRVFKDLHLIPFVGISEKYVPIGNVINIETGEEDVIKHNPNEILIIQFWQASSEYSFEKIVNWNESMIQNYEKWNSKVRIVGVAYDQIDFIEYLNERFSLIENNLVYHYILKGFENEYLKYYINLYCKEFDPEFTLVINKQGNIAFSGNIEGLNLNDFISGLIKDSSNDYYNKKDLVTMNKTLQKIDKKQFKILKNKIYDSCYSIHKVSELNQINFQGKKAFRFDNSLKIAKDEIREILISGKMRIKDFLGFIDMLDKEVFNKLIPKEALIIDIKTINTVDIGFGSKCLKCSRELTKSVPQYFCYKCSFYFCNECGSKEDKTKKFLKKFVHPHNMVYINVTKTSGMTDIEESKLGNNKICDLKLMPGEPEPINHLANCNLCRKEIIGKRFICLTCKPSSDNTCDFCEECFSVFSNKNHKDYSDYSQRIMEKDSHDCNTHIYLRLNFSTGDLINY